VRSKTERREKREREKDLILHIEVTALDLFIDPLRRLHEGLHSTHELRIR
jgi:hypothetical protein